MVLALQRLRTCLLAGAAGDCVGGPWEGRAPTGVPTLPSTPWRVSDDTILSIATARSALRARSISAEAMAAEYLQSFRAKAIPGIGASTLKAMRDLDAGIHWACAGRKGERSAGNGAAMRIAPLAFFLDASDSGHRRTIRDVCRITHHSDEAYVGALAILQTMQHSEASQASTATVLAAIAATLPDTNVRDALGALARLPEGASPLDAVRATGNSGYVAHSVPLAIFLALTAHDLPSAILTAVSCGGDTDTIASMVGQIRGGRGEELPGDWVANLPCAAEVRELCRKLDS